MTQNNFGDIGVTPRTPVYVQSETCSTVFTENGESRRLGHIHQRMEGIVQF